MMHVMLCMLHMSCMSCMSCMICSAWYARHFAPRGEGGGEGRGARGMEQEREHYVCSYSSVCDTFACARSTHTHTHTHTATQNAPHTRQTHHIVPASPLRKFLPRSRNLQRLRLSLSMRPGICLIIAALTLRMNSGRVVSRLHCVQCTERRRSRFGIPMGICAALLWGRCLLACALFLGVAVVNDREDPLMQEELFGPLLPISASSSVLLRSGT